ncbi:hypothetical protein ACQP1P_33705 [Dactylosporangium sp. CA-052675]|uniref:hypothetical protein n=1 Tax=Dactylosporangium sp. CA-052675 TaxID=3239927 RepID=UPI003D8EA395
MPRKLIALAVVLVAAFLLAPGPVAAIGSDRALADPDGLADRLRAGFVDFWRTGERGPDLTAVVHFWLRYHLVKGALAALLLVVLALLGRRLLAAGHRWATIGVAGAGLLALATVMANVQGAVAPFSSLLPMLTESAPDAALAETLGQIRRQLASGEPGPALRAMVGDFGAYHAAMAVVAAVAAIGLVGASVLGWRRFAATRAAVWGGLGAMATLASLAVLVVVIANAGTADDPAPALLAFFEGGW